MSTSNKVVVKTVNRVVYENDSASYKKVRDQIKSLKKEWEKSASPIASAKTNPAAQYNKAASEIKMVSKRLAETRRREEAKSTAHSIALAKKEARAKEAIQKQSAARIKQTMKQMVAANPEMGKMRQFYKQMEREAKKANRVAPKKPFSIKSIDTSGWAKPGGSFGSGMVGKGVPYSPDTVKRQNAQMFKMRKERKAADEAAAAERLKNQRAAAARAARAEDIIGQQRIRLSSKYGAKYHSALGQNAEGQGVAGLNKSFKAGTLSAGQYRASIAALERQFQSAQGSAATFGSVVSDVRRSLISATSAYTAFSAGASILKQGQFFQGLNATMLMVSDSSEEAGKRIAFVREQSYRLGLSLKEASQGYVQMAIAADGVLTKSQTDDLFKSFSEYATALQTDPVKYQRGITAIQQMMGKGQIMAEELKQQLAEGIPGSLQVFLKATQEAFGDSTITIAKMMDMMKKGQLEASKVLPYVAKYYAQAANKGGALDKSLESNRVAMAKLGQMWGYWQDKVFNSGFGDTMTRVFNDLAKVLDFNAPLASGIGHFFSSIISGSMEAAGVFYDSFMFISRVADKVASELGMKGDLISKVLDWSGYVLGVTLFAAALSKVFKILTAITGLKGALREIRALTSVGGAVGAAAGAVGKGAGELAGPMKGGIKMPGFLGKLGLLGDLSMAWGALKQQFGDPVSNAKEAGLSWDNTDPRLKSILEQTGMTTLYPDLKTSSSPTVTPPNMDTLMMRGYSNPLAGGAPSGQVDINVKIDDGKLDNIIQTKIEENDTRNINLLTQGGAD